MYWTLQVGKTQKALQNAGLNYMPKLTSTSLSEDYRRDTRIARLPGRRHGDRITMIVFGSAAVPRYPLTSFALPSQANLMSTGTPNPDTPDPGNADATKPEPAKPNAASAETAAQATPVEPAAQAEPPAAAEGQQPAAKSAPLARASGPLAARGLGVAKPASPTVSTEALMNTQVDQKKPAKKKKKHKVKPSGVSGDNTAMKKPKVKVAVPSLREELPDDIQAELDAQLAGTDLDAIMDAGAGMPDRKEPLEEGQRVHGQVIKIHSDSVYVSRYVDAIGMNLDDLSVNALAFFERFFAVRHAGASIHDGVQVGAS